VLKNTLDAQAGLAAARALMLGLSGDLSNTLMGIKRCAIKSPYG
jgi:hypothetical protein